MEANVVNLFKCNVLSTLTENKITGNEVSKYCTFLQIGEGKIKTATTTKTQHFTCQKEEKKSSRCLNDKEAWSCKKQLNVCKFCDKLHA